MRYGRSVSFIFDNPRWWMYALIGTVCFVVPVAGPIVLTGYLARLLERFHATQADTYEEFDFNRLSEYLSSGVWPFLASLILSIIMIPITLLALVTVVAGVALLKKAAAVGVVILAAGTLLTLLMLVALMFVMVPAMIGSALGRSLGDGLSWKFISEFARKTWRETAVSYLFLWLVWLGGMAAGVLSCGLLLYPVAALVMMCQWHLFWQLYETYLGRGGTHAALPHPPPPPPAAPAPPIPAVTA